MVVVRLKGGLGNQMFQYALGRTLAQLHDTHLLLDRETYLARDPVRRYGLGAFKIDEHFAHPAELNGMRVVDERGLLPYQPGVFEVAPECVLDGYWQSERYFRFIRGLLRQDFQLRQSPSERALEIAAQILAAGPDSVFLLVRRTDYVGSPVYVNLPVEYYERAAWHIARRVPEPRFFVITDDPGWCRQNLRLSFPVTVLDPTAPHEDLWLMSLCRHAVLANSTFSWWGAWLGDQQAGRIVIAPQKWFKDRSLDERDILPDRWVSMSEDAVEMEVKCFDYPLTPESVVLDVGGNTGNWSAEIAHRYNPFIHIFEPVPEFQAALRERFRGNPKVTVHDCGLSDGDREAAISVSGIYSSLHVDVGSSVKVRLRDVASVLAEIGAVDLMTLNIEGEEYPVLEHMLETASAGRCRDLQVQFHYLAHDPNGCERRRAAIRDGLAATHALSFDYPFVWESWRRHD